jgi:hypothetical protein
MARRKVLERWGTKVGNCEVTPQVMWPSAKSLIKRKRPKTPTAVLGPLGIIYRQKEKGNAVADCLDNQFTSYDLCDENHEQQEENRVQGLLASVDDTPLGKVRPCDVHKLANSLKLRKTCGLDGSQTNTSGIFKKTTGLSDTFI